MPAPDRQGIPTGRPLETQECVAWIRKIVGASEDSSSRRVSSHSLKSTMLSYAAKRGIGIPERLQLGYHTSNFQMGMVYSRDGTGASLLVLEKLIKDIANGFSIRMKPEVVVSSQLKPFLNLQVRRKCSISRMNLKPWKSRALRVILNPVQLQANKRDQQ